MSEINELELDSLYNFDHIDFVCKLNSYLCLTNSMIIDTLIIPMRMKISFKKKENRSNKSSNTCICLIKLWKTYD